MKTAARTNNCHCHAIINSPWNQMAHSQLPRSTNKIASCVLMVWMIAPKDHMKSVWKENAKFLWHEAPIFNMWVIQVFHMACVLYCLEGAGNNVHFIRVYPYWIACAMKRTTIVCGAQRKCMHACRNVCVCAGRGLIEHYFSTLSY